MPSHGQFKVKANITKLPDSIRCQRNSVRKMFGRQILFDVFNRHASELSFCWSGPRRVIILVCDNAKEVRWPNYSDGKR
jgi:hypothetical protein